MMVIWRAGRIDGLPHADTKQSTGPKEDLRSWPLSTDHGAKTHE